MAAMDSPAYNPLVTPYEVEREPFPSMGTLREQFRHLLRYAILAPSSHNTQPWMFKLYDNGIAVFVDYTRRLPVADPDNREVLMGIGAAVMNLRIAAQHYGFTVRVDYNFSNASDLPIAFVALERERDPRRLQPESEGLFLSIAKRHTNRHPFLMARVPDSLLNRLVEFAEQTEVALYLSTDPGTNARVAHLVALAEKAQQADPGFRKELAEWMRPNKTQKADGMTGAAFGISDVGSTLAPWAVKTLDLGSIRARHDERLCVEAPALCVLHSEDSIPAWLAVGEVLQRSLLTLTRDGLQFSFFNMPIEIPEARLELRQMLGLKTMPQLLLRIGYSLEKPASSPRRPVEECMVD